MSWRLESLGLYSRASGELRRVDFNLTGLTIISGKSRRGKSSLLDIFDYCLLSKNCPIAKGVIRDRVSYVGITLVRGKERMTIVRPLPDAGKATTTQVDVVRGEHAVLPESPPELRWSLDAAKEALSEFTGIAAIPSLTNVRDLDPEKRFPANIRHCAGYLRQPQDVIASRNVAFPGLDDLWEKRHVADAVDYFLGVLTVERLHKRRELRELVQRRNLLERQRKEDERLRARGWERGLGLWNEACSLGLLDSSREPRSDSELFQELARVTTTRLETLENQSARVETGAVLEEEARLRGEVKRRRVALSELDRLLGDKAAGVSVTQSQLGRLKLRELLPPSSDVDCPLCGSHRAITPHALEHKISQAVHSLSTAASAPQRLQTRLDHQRDLLREEVRDLTSRLALAQERVKALLDSAARDQDLAQEVRRREHLIGRIQEYLASVAPTDLAPADDYEILARAIQELEREVGDRVLRTIREGAEQELSARMTALTGDLKVEFPGQAMRLDLSRFVYEIQFGKQWVPLNEIGSGANWLGYHLAGTLALHSLFRERECPVPAVLMLDQPSQVWFPAEVAQAKGLTRPERDEDLEAVRAVYRLLGQFAGGRHAPQIIVTDHALLDDDGFRACLKHNWHGDEYLVPRSWTGQD